jgi:hypothetical protein
MEKIRSERITAELDTNKATYRVDAKDIGTFVEWWNEYAEELGLPRLSINSADAPQSGRR